MSRQFWVTALLVTVLGLGVYAYFKVFDSVLIVRSVPAKPDVIADQYRAAIKTLESLQLKAERLGMLEALTPQSRPDVLFVSDDRDVVSDRAAARVQEFVAAGGVLVLEAEWHGEDDRLADQFGVTRGEISEGCDCEDEDDENEQSEDEDPFEDGYSDEEDAESSEDDADETDASDANTDAESDGDEAEDATEDAADASEDGEGDDDEAEDLALDLDTGWGVPGADRLKNRHFPDPQLRRVRWGDLPEMLVYLPWQQNLSRFRTEALLADAKGQYILSFRLGKGEVVIMNSLDMIENFELARNDHAEFLWQLIHRHPEPKSVMFFTPERRDLGAWLKKNAWAPILALGILVVFWLWRAMPRFGPISEDPIPVRRRLLEHLRATGNFLAKANQREEISLAALRVVLARVRKEFPHVGIATEAETRDFLVKQFALAPDCAFLIATQQTPANLLDWTRLMRACRDVHAALDHQQVKKR